MTQIAEAYFHLKRISLTQSEVEKVGEIASRFAAEAASELFPPGTVLDVRLEEGSLKGWIAVVGVLYPLYGAISDYKGFKESVAEIVSDGKKFGERVTESIIGIEKLAGARVYRRERRTKTPGKIKRIVQRREWLEGHRAQLTPSAVSTAEQEIEKLLQEVLLDIEPGARAALRKAIGEDAPRLPPLPRARVGLPAGRYEQLPLSVDIYKPDQAQGADYHNRFRLGGGPSDSARQAARPLPLLPFGQD